MFLENFQVYGKEFEVKQSYNTLNGALTFESFIAWPRCLLPTWFYEDTLVVKAAWVYCKA